ncbi:hypothetical protein CDE51_08130 [Pasteurella multocida]|nr:hypothetical protein CDE51_08130 [Pasteurella multocida]
MNKIEKNITLPLQNIFIDAVLKIDIGLDENIINKSKQSEILKYFFEMNKGDNLFFRFLKTYYDNVYLSISFDKLISKKENLNEKKHISYLDSILLSKQEVEKCFKELSMLSALDKNEKESKEIEALKQELQNLQNTTEKLREENKKLKRQLREIEKDSSKYVIAGLLDIIYTNKHKGNRNKDLILSNDRISIHALAVEIGERVENLKTNQRFIGDSYGNTSIRTRLTPIAKEMKILK